MNQLFVSRIRSYFKDDADKLLELLKQKPTQGFFLNTNKANKDTILSLLDFPYEESNLNSNAYYHNENSISKNISFELGLIYPQDVESSFSSTFLDSINPNIIIDLCAAPGGKTINVANIFKDATIISNDISHSRSLELSKNLERLGLTNVSITNKDPKDLVKLLKGNADLVILDAPCSGEGMIRKYPEILDNYFLSNINHLAGIQKELLENAYDLICQDGYILYSTCTYAFEEDESQITSFLNNHSDIELIKLEFNNNYSTLEGTIKLCPLNNTEGQFFALLKKNSNSGSSKIKNLKPIKEKIVDDFILKNFNFNSYFLYKNNDDYYLSFKPLFDLGKNTIRNGIYVGSLINKRFEPAYTLYRSNELQSKFNFVVDLDEREYLDYVKGLEIKKDVLNNYYLITYHNLSLGYAKASGGILKNKYPKGLRRL